jgi:hypothetical protein
MIQIVDRPYLFPARCFFTGDQSEIPVIDTGVNDTEGGRVYISFPFFEELLKATGTATPAEVQALREENARLQKIADKLPNALGRITSELRTVVDSGLADLLTDDPDAGDPVPEAPEKDHRRPARGKPRTDAVASESERPGL